MSNKIAKAIHTSTYKFRFAVCYTAYAVCYTACITDNVREIRTALVLKNHYAL